VRERRLGGQHRAVHELFLHDLAVPTVYTPTSSMIVRRPLDLSSTSILNFTAKPVEPTYGPSADAPWMRFPAFQKSFLASTFFIPCHARPPPSMHTSFDDQRRSLMW
jgi:hypothetical protein